MDPLLRHSAKTKRPFQPPWGSGAHQERETLPPGSFSAWGAQLLFPGRFGTGQRRHCKRHLCTEECQKPQPPLLLKKVSNTPPICIAVRLQLNLHCSTFGAPTLWGKENQYSSHLYRTTPPICIAIRPICIAVLLEKILVVVVTGMFPFCARVISRTAKVSNSPRSLEKWWNSPLFSARWGISRISQISSVNSQIVLE